MMNVNDDVNVLFTLQPKGIPVTVTEEQNKKRKSLQFRKFNQRIVPVCS